MTSKNKLIVALIILLATALATAFAILGTVIEIDNFTFAIIAKIFSNILLILIGVIITLVIVILDD